MNLKYIFANTVYYNSLERSQILHDTTGRLYPYVPFIYPCLFYFHRQYQSLRKWYFKLYFFLGYQEVHLICNKIFVRVLQIDLSIHTNV